MRHISAAGFAAGASAGTVALSTAASRTVRLALTAVCLIAGFAFVAVRRSLLGYIRNGNLFNIFAIVSDIIRRRYLQRKRRFQESVALRRLRLLKRIGLPRCQILSDIEEVRIFR